MTERLPPPPAEPVRSPAVTVAGEEEIRVPGLEGGPSLEARARIPANARRAVVLCHAHPLYGGSMHSPVPLALAKLLAEKGDLAAFIRFNFRGVGASEGTYDDGRGEVLDAIAVLAELRRRAPLAKMSVAGHSFGSWVALRAAGQDRRVERAALVAPSTRFFDFEGTLPTPEERRGIALTVVIGDNDEFATVDEARQLAAQIGASLEVMEGFDHHFLKSRRAMAERVARFVAPEAVP